MKIGIDFDDVVADSLTAIIRMHNEQYGTNLKPADFVSYKFEEIWGGTREEAIKKVDQFFATDQLKEISPMAGSIKAIEALKELGHDLYIITGRSSNDIAQTERWIKYHFSNIFNGVHFANFFTLDKNSIALKKIDICKDLGIELMIDDNLPTALECAAGGIKVFLFDQVWNVHEALPAGITRVHSWDEIVKNLGCDSEIL
jgi:uncharacterized HAD superfamily protein